MAWIPLGIEVCRKPAVLEKISAEKFAPALALCPWPAGEQEHTAAVRRSRQPGALRDELMAALGGGGAARKKGPPPPGGEQAPAPLPPGNGPPRPRVCLCNKD